ncbi:formimidoyltransferase-cyclodeaminase-like [Lineus longissimus]|uniref:formimidoyltransferase-cyclodeaminase-like n=1 Tax=Lineus longissimus TaxID=88925 RepID=UPI00315CD855
MPRLVECVPNFSEGQHKEVIEAIANAIVGTDGCTLLDVDPGVSTNRTVYTFVGSPETVVEGALNAARVASQVIDMTRHHGEHPRLGALDVCPFVPLQNVTMEDCVECAKEFGERLAQDLGVPVFLYGEAATEDHRKTLPQIRAGEYEGMQEKLSKPEWKPDYGEPEFVPSWGVTVTGARKFLIAYNVNMLSTKEQAHRVALNIREQGRSIEEPGKLKHVQAIGWWLDESNLAQVSTNILDHDVTPVHRVYEECVRDAKELNLAVVGSQIVGLLPLKAMLQAADYYMEKENLFILEEEQKIKLVVNRLGLDSLAAFNPKDRIIEYMVMEDKDGPLAMMGVKNFVLTVGSRTPSPGGGSVAALISSLGAALGSMVGLLSYGNKKYESLDAQMRQLIPPFYTVMKDLTQFIDADAAAYADYMMTLKLPKNTPDDQENREMAMQQGLKNAVAIPMNVAMITNSLWPKLKELSEICNFNCKSDLQVSAKSLETGVYGAHCNVHTNLDNIKDDEFKAKATEDIDREWKLAQDSCAEILKILSERTK